jgi:hypothetical protein
LIVLDYNKNLRRVSYYINNSNFIKKGPTKIYFSNNIVSFSFWRSNENVELVKEYYADDGSVRSVELYYNDKPNKFILYEKGKVFDRIHIYVKQCQDTFSSIV